MKKLLKASFALTMCCAIGISTFASIPVKAVPKDISSNVLFANRHITSFASSNLDVTIGLICDISGNGVALRSEPSTSSTRLGLLYHDNGDTILVEKISSDGQWAYGITSIGFSGWVYGDYVGYDWRP